MVAALEVEQQAGRRPGYDSLMPANILNLPSYTVTALQENEHDYHIDAIAKDRPGFRMGHAKDTTGI